MRARNGAVGGLGLVICFNLSKQVYKASLVLDRTDFFFEPTAHGVMELCRVEGPGLCRRNNRFRARGLGGESFRGGLGFRV